MRFHRCALIRRVALVFALIAAVLLTSCQSGRTDAELNVRLFAAASTIDVVTEICALFTQETGIKVETSFAASSAQATMLIQGARADLFLSASTQWSNAVFAEFPASDIVNLMGNRLVLVVPIDSKRKIRSITDLSSAEVHKIAIADTLAVPAGIYSKQALEYAGLWEDVSGKVVGTMDVRQALVMVENDVVECGFVYETDARTSQYVRVVSVVDGHDPIIYPLMMLPNASANGRALFAFLQSDSAKRVFVRHGFQSLPVPSGSGTLVK